MTNSAQRLLRNGSVYTFASMASTATALVVTPILTRSLGIVEYDKVAVAIVILNIAINLLSLGLPTAIIRAAHSDEKGEVASRRIVLMGVGIVTAVATIGATTAALLGIDSGIVLALVAGAAGGAVSMVLAYYVATEKPLFYVVFSFGLSLGGPVAGLIAATFLGPQAENYLLGLAIANLSVATAGIMAMALPGEIQFSKGALSRSLSIGLPMIPHQLAVGTATGAAILTSALLLPTGAAAHTQIALLIGSAPLAIVSALGSAWTPIILSAPIDSRGPRLAETAGLIATIAALGSGALALLGPWFIGLIAPAEEFDVKEMIPLVAVTSIAAAISVAYTSHLQIVIGSGRTRALVVLSPLALGLGFASGLLLVPMIGLIGSGFGFLIVYGFFVLFTRSLAQRISPVRWSETRVWMAIGLATVLGIFGATLPWQTAAFALVRVGLAAVLLSVALVIFARILKSRKTDE